MRQKHYNPAENQRTGVKKKKDKKQNEEALDICNIYIDNTKSKLTKQ